MKTTAWLFFFFSLLLPAFGVIQPESLRCEGLRDPLGIGTPHPALAWIPAPSNPALPDQKQTAFQVLAASRPEWLTEEKADLWNSRKVKSEENLNHPYGGRDLQAGDFCYWKVRIWDEQDRPSRWSEPAVWSAGLLAEKDWKASWIAADRELPPGPVIDRNGFHSLGSPAPDQVKWVQVDLGAPSSFQQIRLWPARPLFLASNAPAFLFPVRYRVEGSDSADFAKPAILVDRTGTDQPSPVAEPLTFSVQGANFRHVRVVATRLAHRKLLSFDDYCFALGELEILDGENNLARGKPVQASDTTELGTEWRRDYLTDGLHAGNRAGASPGFTPPIAFQKAFTVDRRLMRATLHSTALGMYAVSLNGKPVTEDQMAPLWTHYGSRVLAQTYDVTRLVQSGENRIQALVGDGWYRMRTGWGGFFGGNANTFGRSYGDAIQRLRAQLTLEFSDGSREVIGTDPSWTWTRDGSWRTASIYDGSEVDRRISLDSLDSSKWKPAIALPPSWNPQLEPQACPPIRVVGRLRPVSRRTLSDGTLCLDFGQNISGYCELLVSGNAGHRITIRHAQAVDAAGRLYTSNLWGAAGRDVYWLSGRGEERLTPVFTYHGFRYVEITGIQGSDRLRQAEAAVLSTALDERMQFETSDSLLNSLWKTIEWTYRGNLMSVVTDCAGRDERLGWQGDGQTSWQTLSFAFDTAAFGRKWFRDMVDSRGPDRMFNVFSPSVTPGVSPGWSDSGVLVPWFNYVNGGDTNALNEAFTTAREYVDAIGQFNPNFLWENHRGSDFNDWLDAQMVSPPSGWAVSLPGVAPKADAVPTIPKAVFATANWARSARILSEMAKQLGRSEDQAKYQTIADKIASAFQAAFVKPDGSIAGETQSTYAFALACGVLTPLQAARAQERMIQAVEKTGGKLTTGIQTSKYLLLGLSRAGRPDLAYHAAMNPEMPSWRFMLDQGATTIWERFDGFRPGLGFNPDRMNDLNHVGLTSVGEWMVRTIAGLEPDESAPGYRHFFIRPNPPSHLRSSRCRFLSPRGVIEISWERRTRDLSLTVVVPPGASATVILPDGSSHHIGPGRHRI